MKKLKPTTIKKMLKDGKIRFDDFYSALLNAETGDWDIVNNAETIKGYILKMIIDGVHVSHILKALEENPSSQGLYEIWLGNSMNTPEPIETKQDLYNALFKQEV